MKRTKQEWLDVIKLHEQSDISMVQFCTEHKIILYCLPPHASHIIQPCDLTFFGAMKKLWDKGVRAWQLVHPGENLTKQTFEESSEKYGTKLPIQALPSAVSAPQASTHLMPVLSTKASWHHPRFSKWLHQRQQHLHQLRVFLLLRRHLVCQLELHHPHRLQSHPPLQSFTFQYSPHLP